MRSTVRQRLAQGARALDRRAPRPLRVLAREARHRASRAAAPLVSVVVTASDEDAEYVEEALDSVRGQTHRRLEILVVPHGEADAVVDRVTALRGEDYRIRLVRHPAPDRAAARRRGADLARGSYLCFLLGEDVLPPWAVEVGATTLEATGTDFAVGRTETAVSLSPSVLPTYDPAHQRTRRGITLADFPLAVTDTGVGNRLFRTSFWRSARLSEVVAAGVGDAGLALASYRRATRFDVLSRITYTSMNRGHGRAVDQVYDATVDLPGWLADARATVAELESLDPRLRDHWIVGELDGQVQAFLEDVERLDETQWRELHDFVTELRGLIAPEVWGWVRAESRVRLSLLLGGHRTELEELVAARWFERGNVATVIEGGEIHALLPFRGELDLPPVAFVMHEPETPARVLLRSVSSPAPDRLDLRLLARIELVDLADRPPRITARLVALRERRRGRTVPLAVTPCEDDQANMTVGHRYQDYRPGGCALSIDLAALDAGEWSLEIDVEVEGVRRSTTRVDLDRRGSAGLIGSGYLPARRCGDRTVGLRLDWDGRLRFSVRSSEAARLVDATVAGRTLELQLAEGPDELRLSAITARCGRSAVTAPVVGDRATLRLPAGRPRQEWSLEGAAGDLVVPLGWPDAAWSSAWLGAGGGTVALARDGRGAATVVDATDTAVIDRVELAGDVLRVAGRWLCAPPRAARLTLDSGRAAPTAPVRTEPDGTFRCELSLRWDEWGLGETPVPVGEYLFRLGCGPVDSARDGVVLASEEYVEDLLRFQVDARFRLRPVRTGRGAPGVFLAPPVAVEHAGAYPQRRIQESCLEGMGPIDDSVVYFMTYAGSSATDSQLAIHEHLHRTRPDLTLYWGVAASDSRVPDGGIPVLFNTPEWYRVLSTAGYLVQNIDFDRWWRKRPGQRFLQTFHGYPAKSMGLRMWKAKNYTARRQQAELDRTTAGWDLILTPAPEMDVHYRVEYAYDGPICAEGYPRDDALVLPSAAADRERTRRLLGIAPEQKVVLYAPTWRDHLALNWRRAKMVEHLDVVAASEALGEEYVVLLRGHRFNAEAGGRPRGARVIDVTTYPEINDLILASDAAVLDYSSLRFDFALTGRPMVFLVPDLADYTGGIRGFLFDYADTAPGPMLATADEVVAALSDLDALQHAYGDRIAAFNAKYNYLMDGKATERVVARFFGER